VHPGHDDFEALQEPFPRPAWTFQVPDIALPETEPEYWMACDPTVPKLMELPCKLPLMSVGVLPNEEIFMVPLRFDPVCCQVRVNVPV
jgi:hypothetical protein